MQFLKFLPGLTTILVVVTILYLSALVLKPFLYVLIISFIISIFLYPVYEWLLSHLKNAPLAAVVSLVILLLFILLPIVFVLGSVVAEARGLASQLQNQPRLFADIQSYITGQIKMFGIPVDTAQFNLQEQALNLLKTLIQNVGGVLLYAGSLFLNMFFVLITTYFFLLQKKKIASYFMDVHLMSERHFTMLQKRTAEMVNGVVRGNLFVVVIQIIVGTIGFILFGLPAPILLGVLYGLLSLLPAIGVLLIWVPVALFLFFTQGFFITILFIGWFIVTNLAIDNFIAPKIIGSQTKLHQMLIMFSVVGGIQQFGLIGIVLGPVIIALAFVAIEMYKELVEESKK